MTTLVKKPGEGQVYARRATGGSVTVKVASEAATVFEANRPAGNSGGPPPHSHGFDETFYVVSGEWEFVAGGDAVLAVAGTLIHIPRGTVHGFRSTGSTEGKLVGIAVPGGIERFFAEAAQTGDDAQAGRNHGVRWAGS